MKYGFDIKPFTSEEELTLIEEQCISKGMFHSIEMYYGHDLIEEDISGFYRSIRRLVHQYDLEATIHLQPYDLVYPSKAIQETITAEMGKAFEFAKEVNCKTLVMHGGFVSFDFTIPRPFDHLLEQKRKAKRQTLALKIQQLCDIAKGYGLTLALENLQQPLEITITAEDLLEVKRLVDRDNLKFTFDSGHAFKMGQDVADFIRRIGADLIHTHLHDNHGMKDEHLPPGQGGVPWAPLIEALKEVNFNGIHCFELKHTRAKAIMDSYNFFSQVYGNEEIR